VYLERERERDNIVCDSLTTRSKYTYIREDHLLLYDCGGEKWGEEEEGCCL
jgi:hypothetical protein